MKSIVEDKKDAIPSYACWPIAQELEGFAPAAELAEAFYKRAMDEEFSNRGLNYPTHPGAAALAPLPAHGETHRGADLLLKVASESTDLSGSNPSLNPGLDNGRRAQMLGTIAEQLLDLHAPADAVRLLGEMMGEIEKLPEDYRYYPPREMLTGQYRRGIDRALEGLGPEAWPGPSEACFGRGPKPRPVALCST